MVEKPRALGELYHALNITDLSTTHMPEAWFSVWWYQVVGPVWGHWGHGPEKGCQGSSHVVAVVPRREGVLEDQGEPTLFYSLPAWPMYHIHDFPVTPFATKYVIPSRGPCHSLQLAFPYLDSDNFKKRLKKKKERNHCGAGWGMGQSVGSKVRKDLSLIPKTHTWSQRMVYIATSTLGRWRHMEPWALPPAILA